MRVVSTSRWCETLAAIALVVLGVVVWQAGDSIPPSFMDSGFGAGLLPKWLGAALILLSTLLLLEIARSGREPLSLQKAGPSHGDVDSEHESRASLQGLFKPCVLVVLLCLLLVNAEHAWVPFYLSIGAFIGIVIVLLEGNHKRAWMMAVGVSLAMTLMVWIVFAKLFMVIVQ